MDHIWLDILENFFISLIDQLCGTVANEGFININSSAGMLASVLLNYEVWAKSVHRLQRQPFLAPEIKEEASDAGFKQDL
jgi:hypothetical protein